MRDSMTRLQLGITTVLGAAAWFGLITFVALEGREVVVLHTVDARGESRQTRTWVADEDGYVWIEAARADRPFLRDVKENGNVGMRRGGGVYRCQAVVVTNPGGHERIRRLLAEKYGWGDRWIGSLADTSGSVAIRLECR